jgi:hypothetical protein
MISAPVVITGRNSRRYTTAQRRDTRRKLATAVAASGTTLTEIFGVGPVIAAAIIGAVATLF